MKWIFFDIDETLLDHSTAEKVAIKKFMYMHRDVFGGKFKMFFEVWRKITREYKTLYEKGMLTFDGNRFKRMSALFGAYGCKITLTGARAAFREYQAYYKKYVRAFPDVLPCLEELKGNRLGVISNGKTIQQMKKLKGTGILKYFSVFAIADRAGCSKPDCGIFEYACNKAGCKPSEAYFVGDRLDIDAIAGRKAGLKTFWLNRAGNCGIAGNGIREIKGLNGFKPDAKEN
jgi:putative hydrolase of the HAD superfamily